MKYTKQFLKDLAKQHNMNLGQLASQLGMTRTTLERYYNDKNSQTKWGMNSRKRIEAKIEYFVNKSNLKEKVKLGGVTPNSKYIKKYLESAEDICMYLSQGYEINQENSKDYLKLVENIVVRFRDNSPVFINGAISLEEKYYVNMPKPIIVKVGKKYLTRGGDIAIVVSETVNGYKAILIGIEVVYFVDGTGLNLDNATNFDFMEEIDD